MPVKCALICLDVTEDVIDEALARNCEMIISHHPLLFHGLKQITGVTETERIVAKALKHDLAIYSAHTNLDAAAEGVSHEMAHTLNVRNCRVLDAKDCDLADACGIGVIGDIKPTPKLEFLRKVKETFGVKALRYSRMSPQLVIKRVALCGGSGAYLIPMAVKEGADIIITGDIKYHDYTTHADDIVIADIGHFESEVCALKILARILRQALPACDVMFAEKAQTPIGVI